MTSITVRTDDNIKNILERKAELHGLTLSGYINLMFRQHITRDESDEAADDLFISEEHMARELAIAEARFNDPNAKYISADKFLAELDKKYGL